MFPFRFKENIYPLRLQAFYKACNAALHLGGGGVKACCRADFSRLMSACSPLPITAPTSQVGEVAVVRTPVSYKCGWGSVKTNPHPNLPQLGKECACVAQLAYSPRPLWERAEFVSEPCELRNSGEGLKNISD